MVVQIKGVFQGSAKFLSRTKIGATSVSDYWYAKLDTTTTDVGNGVAIDSSGNVYVVGIAWNGSNYDILIIKYNNTGSLLWQRKLSGASSTDVGEGIAVDNLGNVYIVGYTNNALTDNILIAKYNTSGTLLWQTILVGSSGDYGYGVAIDSSGNVYITGTTGNGTDYRIITAKYDTNGNLTWQRQLTGTEGYDYGAGSAVDSFGNVYIFALYRNNGSFAPLIVKYNNSGSLLWQRKLSTGSSFNTNGKKKIAVDSSGNVYIVFSRYIVGSGAYDAIIAKYDTSGTYKWQRKFGNFANGRDEYGNGIAVDSSSNVYITGSTYNGTNDDILIAKYDTLGTIQWQRTLASAGGDTGFGIAVDSSGTNVYITGYIDSIDSKILIARLPADGSIVNPTYTGKLKLIHSASSLSDAAGDFTASTPSPLLTDSAGTLDSFKCDLYSNDPGLTHSLTYNKPIQVQLLNGGGAEDIAYKIAVDSYGNYYVTGYNGTYQIVTIKFNSSGNIVWQRRLNNGSKAIGADAITVDSSGNVYVVGGSVSSIWSDPLIIKYSPSGTLLWKFNVNPLSGSYNNYSFQVVVDSFGKVYAIHELESNITIVKYDDSGGSVWQRKLSDTQISSVEGGVAIDSSGNVYITGTTATDDILIAKYDTDGNNIWQRTLAGNGIDIGGGIAVDPSGNVYVVGISRQQSSLIVTAKYNNNGNILWQRTLAGSNDSLYRCDIVVDSSGNSYITTLIPATGVNSIFAKYDTDGIIQWQRKLSGAIIRAITLDSSGTYAYIAGQASNGSNSDMLIAKIYINGGTTGTYGLFTYSVSTLAEAEGTRTPSTPSPLLGSQSLSRTHSIPTFTEAAGTLTSSYQGLVANKDVWTSTFGASGSSLESSNGIALDSAKNIYTIGKTLHTSGTTDSLLVKYNNSGTMQWQRTLTGSNSNDFGNGIAIDSSDNIYTVGTTGSNSNDIVISKYNTSGVIQWQAILGTNVAQAGNGIAVDSSGNVYITGTTINGTDYDIITAKYNSSGTIQWQRQLGIIGSNKNDEGFGIAVDSSSNVYITGYGDNTANFTSDILIVKYDTNGNINNGWQRRLTGGVAASYGRGIVVDSSGNVYIVGLSFITSYSLTIAKYNPSGGIVWQRTLDGAYSDIGIGIAVDSSDNVYVTGYTGTGSYETSALDIIIAKYNPSGGIVWQRTLRSSDATSDQGYAIKVDGDYVYITGATSTKSLIAKLPNDGSYTGTYGGFTYEISTLGESAGTLTPSTPSPLLTDAASTLTSSLILSSTELNASSVNNYLR